MRPYKPPESGGMAITSLPDLVLSQLSGLIAARMGWHFPADRWADLERGIRAVARDLGFSDVQGCIDWLHSAPLTQQQVDVLTDHFTVGETYFFREHRALEILTTQILPSLRQTQQPGERHMRIWSAACCSGEEPYSIAITLATAIPHLSDWRLSIIGTDINPRFLQRAVSGVYTEWSFRSTPTWIRDRYFQRTVDNRFRLCPEIKQMVTFFPLNLADAAFSAPLNTAATIDVIFCRNVFIYFSPDRAQAVIRNFHHTLTDGGWIIVSPSETPYLAQSPFTAVSFPGIIVHRKSDRSSQPVPGESPRAIPSQRAVSNPLSSYPPSDAWARVTSSSSEHAKKDEQPTTKLPVSAAKSPVGTAQVPGHPSSKILAEARALYAQGRYAEVTEKLRSSLLLQNQPLSTLNQEEVLLLIRAYTNQRALDEAISWCNKAIARDVLNPLFYYLQATVLLEQGREEDAALVLRQTLYLDSGFVLAHFTLGNLSLRQKKTSTARRHFQNALVLLRKYEHETIIPESEGLTAGRLSNLIRTMFPE